MRFASGAEMYNAILDYDLYCPEKETYVFLYNDVGAVCVYSISNSEAKKLAVKAKEADEYWGAFLGIGGNIFDSPMEFCDENFDGEWNIV